MQLPVIQKFAADRGIRLEFPDWLSASQFTIRHGQKHKPLRVGQILLREEKLKPKHPVVILPGDHLGVGVESCSPGSAADVSRELTEPRMFHSPDTSSRSIQTRPTGPARVYCQATSPVTSIGSAFQLRVLPALLHWRCPDTLGLTVHLACRLCDFGLAAVAGAQLQPALLQVSLSASPLPEALQPCLPAATLHPALSLPNAAVH